MEKITKHFTHDYENDTTIEWVNTGMYSMLNCSFTSEDPNYGTDTIHYGVGSSSVKPIAQMAYEMLDELTPYLGKMDRGAYDSISSDVRSKYGEYNNSTLYAIEHALSILAEDYRSRKWFGHLEDVTREIARRIVNDGKDKFSFCQSDQSEWDCYSSEEYEHYGSGWYGIRRLKPIFDNESYEYIIAIGYYGGGSFESVYVYHDGADINHTINQLGRAMCNAIMKLEHLNEQSIVYAVEEGN